MFAPSIITRVSKLELGGVAGLYFRVRATDHMWAGTNILQAIYEFELREAGDATGVNLSLIATKTASDTNVNQPNGGGDGNPATYWQSVMGASSAVSWWRCQFATPKTVRSVIIKPHTLYYPKNYVFERSDDGVAWTIVKSVMTTGGSGATQTYLNIVS